MNKLLLLFILVIPCRITLADVWDNPKTIDYYSADSSYMIRVIPTKIPEKYYKWLSAKPKKKAKYAPSDTTIIYCHAVFYKINKHDTLVIWERKLINPIAPVHVVIAPEGKSFITFDNWYSAGYGLEVLVIYNEHGDLIKRYKLEDFSPFPINDYTRSISSIWWRCGAKYIDGNTVEICFQDENKKIKKKYYNLTLNEFE